MKVFVRCPRCGHVFEVNVEQRKGRGAHYGEEIKRLGRIHVAVLQVLAERNSWMTKKAIGAALAERGLRVSGNSLSGRLSELLGAGYVEMIHGEVREFDPEEKRYRFVKKPLWRITPEGLKALGKATNK